MAWFDYLGGIAGGLGQVGSQLQVQQEQRKKEEAALAAEELSRMAPGEALTPEQVKRYSRVVGAGSFMRTPDGQIVLKQTPQQEVAGYQLQKARDVQAAEQEWQRLTTPDASGNIPLHAQPLEKVLALGRKAGVNPLESGVLSPAQVDQSLKQVGSVVAKMQQMEAAQQAKIRELELKSASDKEINQARAEAAAIRAQSEQTAQMYRLLAQQQFQVGQREAGQQFTAEQNWQNAVNRIITSTGVTRQQAEAQAGPRPGQSTAPAPLSGFTITGIR